MSDIPYTIWLLALGAAGGSAMAALADRLNTGQNWVRAASVCEMCETPLTMTQRIPLISYIALRGRCGHCQARIPFRLFLAEVAGLLAGMLALLWVSPPFIQIGSTIFLVLLLGLFLSDLQTRRLPDVLTATLAAVGTGIGTYWHGLTISVFTACLGVAALWLLAKGYTRFRGHDGLGMGDVKMIAGLAAMAGPMGLPWLTLIASVTALSVSALQPTRVHRRTEIRFGCYLAVAGVIVWGLQARGLL